MTRDELEAETRHLDLLEELTAAKASGDKERLRAAKVAVYEFRTAQRSAREAELDVAAPETIKASAQVKEV